MPLSQFAGGTKGRQQEPDSTLKIWIDQCEAAEQIEADYGTEKALGYLIGEKLLNFRSQVEDSVNLREDARNLLLFERAREWLLEEEEGRDGT